QLAEKYRSLPPCAKVYRGSFHQVGQVHGTPPPSQMARRQSCGDRSRLDPLERRRGDAESYANVSEGRRISAKGSEGRRILVVPELSGSLGYGPYSGAAGGPVPRFSPVARQAGHYAALSRFSGRRLSGANSVLDFVMGSGKSSLKKEAKLQLGLNRGSTPI